MDSHFQHIDWLTTARKMVNPNLSDANFTCGLKRGTEVDGSRHGGIYLVSLSYRTVVVHSQSRRALIGPLREG